MVRGRGRARRYAKALFGLASEAQAGGRGARRARRRSPRSSREPRAADVLLQPLHPAEQRRGVLQPLAEKVSAGPLLRQFYSFLIDQRRMLDLAGIRDEFVRLAEEAAGAQCAARSCPRAPLDAAQVDRVRAGARRARRPRDRSRGPRRPGAARRPRRPRRRPRLRRQSAHPARAAPRLPRQLTGPRTSIDASRHQAGRDHRHPEARDQGLRARDRRRRDRHGALGRRRHRARLRPRSRRWPASSSSSPAACAAWC